MNITRHSLERSFLPRDWQGITLPRNSIIIHGMLFVASLCQRVEAGCQMSTNVLGNRECNFLVRMVFLWSHAFMIFPFTSPQKIMMCKRYSWIQSFPPTLRSPVLLHVKTMFCLERRQTTLLHLPPSQPMSAQQSLYMILRKSALFASQHPPSTNKTYIK